MVRAVQFSGAEASKARDHCASLAKATDRRREDWWGCCPFHEERTPSFHIDLRGYFCFGCGAHGSHVDLVMRLRGLDFKTALRELHFATGVPADVQYRRKAPLTDQRHPVLRKVMECFRTIDSSAKYREMNGERQNAVIAVRDLLAPLMPKRHFERLLADLNVNDDRSSDYAVRSIEYRAEPVPWEVAGRHAENGDLAQIAARIAALRPGSTVERYHRQRGVSDRTAALYGLGPMPTGTAPVGEQFSAWAERMVFPLRAARGQIVGLAGRVLNGGLPKYRNTSLPKGEHLYGLDLAAMPALRAGYVLVVEGYADVWALREAGMENVVATMGTALTARQARLLRPYGVVLALDNDPAGQMAAVRAFPRLLMAGIWPRVMDLPAGTDPDDVVRTEGAQGVRRRLDTATALYSRWLAQADSEQVCRLVREVSDPWVSALLAKDVTERTGRQALIPTPVTVGGLRIKAATARA